MIVGDVSGHGRQALPHTALVRFTLRAYLEAGLSPRVAVQTAGAVLERQLGGSFATVVAATYHPRERILIYACAGHPPPLVLGAARRSPPITACSAPPIGAGMRTGTRQTVVSMPGRAQVCFYTDGVTEARVGIGSCSAPSGSRARSPSSGRRRRPPRSWTVSPRRPTAPRRHGRVPAAPRGRRGGDRPCWSRSSSSTARRPRSERTEQFLRACGVAPAEIGRGHALRAGAPRAPAPFCSSCVSATEHPRVCAAARQRRAAPHPRVAPRAALGVVPVNASRRSPPTRRWCWASRPLRCRSRALPRTRPSAGCECCACTAKSARRCRRLA